MKTALAIILICIFAFGCFVIPFRTARAYAKTEEKPDPFKGYSFVPLPAFEQFTKDELAQLYMSGFDPRTAEITDELAPQGVPSALKLNVNSTGVHAVSTSRHLHVKDELYYDGLKPVGEKTFNGGIAMRGHKGFMFRVDGYSGAIVVVMRSAPCGGPYGYEGDAELQSIFNQYGMGHYYRTATLFPDENGYVKVEFGCVHGGYVWWDQGDIRQEFDKLNSIDIIFGDQKLNVGTAVYVSDFKLYDEPPAGRSLEELIEKLEAEDASGEHAEAIATARAALESGTSAQQQEQIKTLTLLLKPTLLRELYANTYASMKRRITTSGYAPTSVTGLYDGMYIRDTSIQSLMHTNQGDTDLSRSLLRYVLSVYRHLGTNFPNHVISDLKETAYGNTDGGSVGTYSALMKIGGEAVATQEIAADKETVISVNVWLSRTDAAYGMLEAELKRGDTTVSRIKIKTADLPKSKGCVSLEFGLPLTPVKSGNYTLTLSAPDSPANSVTWYGRRNFKGLATTLNGKTVNGEASFEAFRTGVTFESTDVQPDTIFALAHAWIAYAKAAPNTQEDAAFIAESYPIVKSYVEAFITDGYINEDLKLIRTDFLEHSREGRKWKSYDLITNVYGSQVFHEFAEFDSALGNAEEAARWAALAEKLREGINETLTTEVGGKRIYAELIDLDHDDTYIQGMSWVNLAPIAAGWYGMDVQLMKNTFEVYRELATVSYGGIPMLDACYNMITHGYGNHVIGKGYSWELMFSAATGDTDRVGVMTEFMLMNSPASNMYPESWWYPNRFSDVGNQEHSSWIAYAMSTVYPELKEAVRREGDVDGDGETTVTDALAALRMTLHPKNYYDSEKRAVDMDGDGEPTVSDVLRIMRRAAGIA